MTGNSAKPVAVVTGASSGFGESITRELAERGWHTVGVARSEDKLQMLADETGGEYKVCDIADAEQVGATACKILDNNPAINLLVNNAGMPQREALAEAEMDEIEQVLMTNYIGGLRLTRALREGLEAAEGADVIDMVSAAAGIDNPASGAYSVSKKAQLAASRLMRHDLAGSDIRVHSILPGKADTPGHPQPPSSSPLSKLTRTTVEEVTEATLARIGRRPKEIYVPGVLKAVAVVNTVAPVTTTKAMGKLFG